MSVVCQRKKSSLLEIFLKNGITISKSEFGFHLLVIVRLYRQLLNIFNLSVSWPSVTAVQQRPKIGI